MNASDGEAFDCYLWLRLIDFCMLLAFIHRYVAATGKVIPIVPALVFQGNYNCSFTLSTSSGIWMLPVKVPLELGAIDPPLIELVVITHCPPAFDYYLHITYIEIEGIRIINIACKLALSPFEEDWPIFTDRLIPEQ